MVALHHNGTRFWAMAHCYRPVTRAHTLCYPYSPPTLCMHTVTRTHCSMVAWSLLVPLLRSHRTLDAHNHLMCCTYTALYCIMVTSGTTSNHTLAHTRTPTHYQATPCLHTVAPHNPLMYHALLHAHTRAREHGCMVTSGTTLCYTLTRWQARSTHSRALLHARTLHAHSHYP